MKDVLSYYLEPGPFTTLGGFGEQVDALPNDIGQIAHAVQMLLVHRAWANAYNVTMTSEREQDQHLHGTGAMLSTAMERGPERIGEVRLPEHRVAGICRHFSTVMAAFLKRKRTPARARCGFATYFQEGKYVDHWVCEYWNVAQDRWIQVDAQLDTLQQQIVKADFDPLDTPRDRFLVAGDVWRQYRKGEIDGEACGIFDMWGDWYIRGNHALDIASLQRVELLPWEPFGISKSPGSTTGDTPELLEVVDKSAALTAAGDDESIGELLSMADVDTRLQPPGQTIEAAQKTDALAASRTPQAR